jgi:DNA-binding transcriptional ArsR family regulator
MTPARVEEVVVALADATRRQVLDRLAAHGEATATRLAAELPVSRQAIVKHLAVLEQAGLVVGGRTGREVRYTLRSQPLDATARWMAGLAAEWDARLAAIKRVAEADARPTGRPDERPPRRRVVAEAGPSQAQSRHRRRGRTSPN